jgi:hypothetical protein
MHVEWFKLAERDQWVQTGFVEWFWWTHLCGLVWFDATMNNYDGGVGWSDDKKTSWFGVGRVWFSNHW